MTLALFFSGIPGIYANSADVANRRTAIRYLQLGKQYASEKAWKEADSQVNLGLAYDDSISDLWYLRAVSQAAQGAKKAEVLPFISKAISKNQWADYNRDSARIFYADLLCTTLNYEKAVSVLNEKPFIYSADAEYIRAKSYYSMQTADSVKKARSIIESARRIYPADVRFPELFFAFEFRINDGSRDAQRIASSFIPMLQDYRNLSLETELFALNTLEGEEKVRRLMAFKAANKKTPYFSQIALENGITDEFLALDMFYQFADKEISLDVIENLSKTLKDEEAKKELSEYLASYSGTIIQDTNGDLTPNLTVKYSRGRPEYIVYDRNQDEVPEWTCSCDFGLPQTLEISENNVGLTYSTWPSVKNALFKFYGKASDLEVELVSEAFAWSPFAIDYDDVIKESLDLEFFMPKPQDDEKLSGEQLILSASSYTLPSKERENAVIKVSLLDGKAQSARYFEGETMYASAQFTDGIPELRIVDTDGDGIFETTETYGFSKNLDKNFITKADEMQVMTNIFGQPAEGTGFYVKMIQIDRNGDTVPEFTEEYTEGFGKISSWDFDSDGLWDTRYIRYPEEKNKKLREDSCFHKPVTNETVTVTSEDGKPILVKVDERRSFVSKGNSGNFYWVENSGNSQDEAEIILSLSRKGIQGEACIVQTSEGRFYAVRIGEFIFGEKIPDGDNR